MGSLIYPCLQCLCMVFLWFSLVTVHSLVWSFITTPVLLFLLGGIWCSTPQTYVGTVIRNELSNIPTSATFSVFFTKSKKNHRKMPWIPTATCRILRQNICNMHLKWDALVVLLCHHLWDHLPWHTFHEIRAEGLKLPPVLPSGDQYRKPLTCFFYG